MNTVTLNAIFDLSDSVRYVAVYNKGRLQSKAKPNASGCELLQRV